MKERSDAKKPSSSMYPFNESTMIHTYWITFLTFPGIKHIRCRSMYLMYVTFSMRILVSIPCNISQYRETRALLLLSDGLLGNKDFTNLLIWACFFSSCKKALVKSPPQMVLNCLHTWKDEFELEQTHCLQGPRQKSTWVKNCFYE